MGNIWQHCKTTEEYLGSTVGYDAEHGCVIVKESGFRSKSRERESWEFVLDQYASYDTRRIIFDIRGSIYPSADSDLKTAFNAMARSLPPSTVGFLVSDRQPEIVQLSVEAIEAAGHRCCASQDIDEIFGFFRMRG
jgi:hypothetical protein